MGAGCSEVECNDMLRRIYPACLQFDRRIWTVLTDSGDLVGES